MTSRKKYILYACKNGDGCKCVKLDLEDNSAEWIELDAPPGCASGTFSIDYSNKLDKLVATMAVPPELTQPPQQQDPVQADEGKS